MRFIVLRTKNGEIVSYRMDMISVKTLNHLALLGLEVIGYENK